MATTQIRLWSLLTEYMHPRIYAGSYGVHKFLELVSYKQARDVYWKRFPCIPPGVFTTTREEYDNGAYSLGKTAHLLDRLGFKFEGGRSYREKGRELWKRCYLAEKLDKISVDHTSFKTYKAKIIKEYQESHSRCMTDEDRAIEKADLEDWIMMEVDDRLFSTPASPPANETSASTYDTLFGTATSDSIFGSTFG